MAKTTAKIASYSTVRQSQQLVEMSLRKIIRQYIHESKPADVTQQMPKIGQVYFAEQATGDYDELEILEVDDSTIYAHILPSGDAASNVPQPIEIPIHKWWNELQRGGWKYSHDSF